MFQSAAYVLILFETFSTAPRLPDGVWRGTHRWNDLIFNSERSFHTYPSLTTSGAAAALNLQPFWVEDGILSIVPAPIPADARAAVDDVLRDSGASAEAIARVTHYTGMLSLHDSWAETYGYFEIRARVPGAVGYWPAFWLAPGTKGWPPEIDIFEIDARDRDGPPVMEFDATVHFDGTDATGRSIAAARIDNPHRTKGGLLEGAVPQQPIERQTPTGPRWALTATVESAEVAGAGDLSAEFHVWGLEWTPDEIVWYFGPTANAMAEVYRTPTPPDLHSPLYVIANVEVGGLFAGEIGPEGPEPDRFEIDYIKVFARRPETEIAGTGEVVGTDGSDYLRGSDGDDVFRPGGGFDVIETGAGQDEIHLARVDGNAFILGFGPEDRLVISGYRQEPSVLYANAVQVGSDLWIRDPGDPFVPRTLILGGVVKADLSPGQIVSGSVD